MSQLAYSLAMTKGRVGQLADSSDKDAITKVASAALVVGCFVVRDASDLLAKHPTSAAEVLAGLKAGGGVALHNHTLVCNPDVAVATIPANKEFSALRQGRVLVLVEEAVTQGEQAYIRFANGVADVAKIQKGAFRKSADGSAAVAQIATVTPTAVNATLYALEIKDSNGLVVAVAEYLSDGSASATEICDGLRTGLGTVPGVTLSGTATLIVTASVAGTGFSVQSIGDGALAVAATLANVAGVPTAVAAPGCYYAQSALAGELVALEVEMGGN